MPAAAAADTAASATTTAAATTRRSLGGVPAGAVVRNVEYVTGSAIGNDTSKQAFAQCPAGKQVIGGIGGINGANTADVFLQRSQSANGHTQWFPRPVSPAPAMPAGP